jgi:hypothetical protein
MARLRWQNARAKFAGSISWIVVVPQSEIAESAHLGQSYRWVFDEDVELGVCDAFIACGRSFLAIALDYQPP